MERYLDHCLCRNCEEMDSGQTFFKKFTRFNFGIRFAVPPYSKIDVRVSNTDNASQPNYVRRFVLQISRHIGASNDMKWHLREAIVTRMERCSYTAWQPSVQCGNLTLCITTPEFEGSQPINLWLTNICLETHGLQPAWTCSSPFWGNWNSR